MSRSRSKLPFSSPAHHQQVAQLAVVDAYVGVDQVRRYAPVGNRVLQVVEHHVGVVQIGGGFLREAVAVVPLAHDAHDGLHVLVEHAQVAVGVDQAPHLRLGEADHLVEVRLQADVGADVEAAGHVVHGDRRHAGDEQPLQAAAAAVGAGLQGGEEVAVEAAAMGEGVVRLGAVVGEHGVGEVVVLVDDHVQPDVVIARVLEQLSKLGGDRGRREDIPHRRFGKQVGVAPQLAPELYHAVGFELPLQCFELVVDRREVEAQGDVAALFPGRVLPDVGAGEGGLEVVRPEAVVVVLQQRHPQRLAEPAWADQEGVALLLQAAHEAGLVDVQPPVQADAPEVGLAVGNARVCGWRAHCVAWTLTLSFPRRHSNAVPAT